MSSISIEHWLLCEDERYEPCVDDGDEYIRADIRDEQLGKPARLKEEQHEKRQSEDRSHGKTEYEIYSKDTYEKIKALL